MSLRTGPGWGRSLTKGVPVIGEFIHPNLSYRRSLRKALSDLSPGSDGEEIVAAYEQKRTSPGSGIPKELPLQIRFLLRLAARNVALFKVMTERGLSKDLIDSLLHAINRELSGLLGSPLYRLSRIAGCDPSRRLRFIDSLLYRTLFVRPFARTMGRQESGLSFVITYCPFAVFYAANGAAPACAAAACSLDAQLASEWNADFERTSTIAAGAAGCDFLFRPRDRIAEEGNLTRAD